MTNPTDRRIQTVCLLILAAVALGGALHWLKPVMIPFVLAVFIALALTPVVAFLARNARLPRIVAIGVTLTLAFAGLAGIGLLVSRSVGQLKERSAEYEAQLRSVARGVIESLPLDRFGMEAADLTRDLPMKSIGTLLLSTGDNLVALVSEFLLILIFVVYLLSGDTATRARGGTWGEIERRIERFLVTKLALSALTGVLVWMILAFLGVELALVFGLFAFVLNFIPSVGSVIATLLPVPVILVSPDLSPMAATLAIVLPGAVQFAIGNVVEPRMMGEALDLHPIVILLSLIFWGMLWGIPGMLLATPITAIAKILLSRLDRTRGIADLLGGRMDAMRSSGQAGEHGTDADGPSDGGPTAGEPRAGEPPGPHDVGNAAPANTEERATDA